MTDEERAQLEADEQRRAKEHEATIAMLKKATEDIQRMLRKPANRRHSYKQNSRHISR